MLQVRDLRTTVLKSASLALSAGECVVVRGASGAGKTLLLRAIADLDPNEGLVALYGRDRSTIPGPEWRRLVGYVPAEPGWWAETIGEHFHDRAAAYALVRELGFSEETPSLADQQIINGRTAPNGAGSGADSPAEGRTARRAYRSARCRFGSSRRIVDRLTATVGSCCPVGHARSRPGRPCRAAAAGGRGGMRP